MIVLLVIIALLSLSLLVVVHEFGHYLAAKFLGVWPEEFGIGLPPRVWGKKIGETLWSVNALPLGGFVRLHGEAGDGKVSQPKRAFVNQPKWKRAVIALAGVTMNMVYAVFAFALIFFVTGIPQGIKVDAVTENSPAAALGLEAKDVIVSLNERNVYSPIFFATTISSHAGRDLTVSFMKSETNELVTNTVKMRDIAPEGEGLLGVSYTGIPHTYLDTNFATRFVYSFKYGALQTYDFSRLIIRELSGVFAQLVTGSVPKGLAGPLGVVGVTAQAARQGIFDLIGFSALISINLALFNILPFPPLDGSRVMFLFIEQVVGRKKLPRIEEKIHAIGMYILIALVVLLTIREVPKLIGSKSLEGFVETLSK